MPPPAGGIRSTYSLVWPSTSAENTRLSLDQPAARLAALSSDTAAAVSNRWLNHVSSRALVSARSRCTSAIPAMPDRVTYDALDVNDRSFTPGLAAVIRSSGDSAAGIDVRPDRGHLAAAGGARARLPGHPVHLASSRARAGRAWLSGGGAVAARIRRAHRPVDQRRNLRPPPSPGPS